jgi:hypothetical protein
MSVLVTKQSILSDLHQLAFLAKKIGDSEKGIENRRKVLLPIQVVAGLFLLTVEASEGAGASKTSQERNIEILAEFYALRKEQFNGQQTAEIFKVKVFEMLGNSTRSLITRINQEFKKDHLYEARNLAEITEAWARATGSPKRRAGTHEIQHSIPSAE